VPFCSLSTAFPPLKMGAEMTLETVGRNFLELEDQDGVRIIVRISSIQMAADRDQFQDETMLIVAGRTIYVRVSLDEFRRVLMGTAEQR